MILIIPLSMQQKRQKEARVFPAIFMTLELRQTFEAIMENELNESS